eukprot:Hpha_TRINITY_DN16730_c0_g1::TRINITY_DN16730_c0_g1_i1::g.79722::m.79722
MAESAAQKAILQALKSAGRPLNKTVLLGEVRGALNAALTAEGKSTKGPDRKSLLQSAVAELVSQGRVSSGDDGYRFQSGGGSAPSAGGGGGGGAEKRGRQDE